MKRRFFLGLTALVATATVAFGSPGGVSASCEELDWAISYHSAEGNIGYALQLATWADDAGCDVTRSRAPYEERRLIA
jgi:hypothetical protein